MNAMYRPALLTGFALFYVNTAIAAGPTTAAADADWLPEAAEAAAKSPTVPVVPLPPAVYGSAAAVGMLLVLRYTRARRWLTLRS